ncbi:glucoamylase family protein [Kaistia terrae]|uniref:Glucoamylase family protein n=1 Tax=Kaistia terrae TaxID=537017 RepID=A0ABW0Q4S3_9HYPH|nr:glucoamylase family protein [Kaistia terrae]MCX5580854.1 DUF3131 domain-containing protein [Kaistia terrae]
MNKPKSPKHPASSKPAKAVRAPSLTAATTTSGRLDDDALLERVQRQSFRYFWDFGHPVSGLARDRTLGNDEVVTLGGSGFGVMAIVIAVERGWISRAEAVERLHKMIGFLEQADSFHGVYPHFMNGTTGKVVRYARKDDGADLVETAFWIQGLIAAQVYFDRDDGREPWLRGRIEGMRRAVEWSWFTRDGREGLYWHWSPNHGWAMNHEILGWNECLILFVLAAGAEQYSIPPIAYHNGFAQSRTFINRRTQYGVDLPLGPDGGGPLFFAHYSFLGLDPRGLTDRYADYWAQNVAHTQLNYAYCVANPGGFKGYGPDCWGLSASDNPTGYSAHAPDNDRGVIAPTAAISSLPYAPDIAMQALRHFDGMGDRLWGEYGFFDAFSESADWVAKTHLAIDQGPQIIMIENYRTGLIWDLFMRDAEVRRGLQRLDFQSPHFSGTAVV